MANRAGTKMWPFSHCTQFSFFWFIKSLHLAPLYIFSFIAISQPSTCIVISDLTWTRILKPLTFCTIRTGSSRSGPQADSTTTCPYTLSTTFRHETHTSTGQILSATALPSTMADATTTLKTVGLVWDQLQIHLDQHIFNVSAQAPS